MSRVWIPLLIAAALLWHVLAVWQDAWPIAQESKHARDYASYHYAVKVAFDGGDPYDRTELNTASRAEKTRSSVHPFFYPPPFLLVMAWTQTLDLFDAYRLWFWLDEVFLWLSVLALWRWWRPLGSQIGVLLFLAVAWGTCIPNNHQMGQFNFPVLAMVCWGLVLCEEDRPGWGGLLVGTAAMMKMSPALFVAWWLLDRQWKAVGAAICAAIAWTLLSTATLGIEHQIQFFTEVLPAFQSGNYNGLTVPIHLFGNHSLPNVYHLIFPSGQEHQLSTSAARLSSLSALTLVIGLGAWFYKAEADRLGRAAQACAVAVLMLIVPVYTYEHHLVWALPALVLSAWALLNRRLHPIWAVPVVLAGVAWGLELSWLRSIARTTVRDYPLLFAALREAKFGALIVLLAATAWLGRSGQTGGRTGFFLRTSSREAEPAPP